MKWERQRKGSKSDSIKEEETRKEEYNEEKE